MGADLYCIACGVSYISSYEAYTPELKTYKTYKTYYVPFGRWMTQQCLLTRDKWICGEFTDWGSGTLDNDDRKETYYIGADLWNGFHNGTKDAIAMHRDCYLFLKSKNVMNVTFNDLSKKMNINGCATIDYNVVNKYQQQYFDTETALRKQPWILESPLKNQTKANYVYKIWLKILRSRPKLLKKKGASRKLPKYSVRPSPSEHAKDHKGKIKIGNNGYKYISTKDKNGVYKWKLA